LAGLLYFKQEAILFPAFGPDYTQCTQIQGLGYTAHRVQLRGESVRLLWWGAAEARGTLLLFHGNGGTVCYRVEHAGRLRHAGWNVALAEYPGYGRDAGRAGQAAILRNALAAFDVARIQGGGLPLLLFGKSLGSGVATYVASQRPVAGLILQAPYPSLTAVARHAYPWLPVGLLLRHPMPAQDWAPQVRAPVLVLHGEADRLIPIALGRQQAKHFASIEFVSIPGAGHNDISERDPELYWSRILEFCTRSLGKHWSVSD
jgi:alpha-beta hydrolase superfamily lysophospholipase